MSKRCLILCRTSGNDEERDSMDLQELTCRQFADENNWSVVKVLREDVRGVSGQDYFPPKTLEALELAKQGKFDILLLRNQARWARKVKKAMFYEVRFNLAGVEVYYVESDNSKTDEAEYMRILKGMFAQVELSEIVKRMHSRKRYNAENGSMITSPNNTPFGYETVKQDKIFVPQIKEDEAKIVELIFDLYVNKGYSINKIKVYLNEHSIPTFSMFRGKTRFGDKSSTWHNGVVRRILKNETYCGTWHYGKTKNLVRHNEQGERVFEYIQQEESNWIEVNVPKIVSRETWQAAQDKLESNKAKTGRPVKHPDKYLLRKRITCKCGKKMTCINSRNFYGYKCNSDKLQCDCDFGTTKASPIDKMAWKWLKTALSDDNLGSRLDKWISELESTNDQLRTEYNLIAQRLNELNQKYDNLLDLMIGASDFGKQKQKSKLEELETGIKEDDDILARLQMEIENNEGELIYWAAVKRQMKNPNDCDDMMIQSGLSSLNKPMTFKEKLEQVEKYDLRAEILNDDEIKFSCNLDISGIAKLSYPSTAKRILFFDVFPLRMKLPVSA